MSKRIRTKNLIYFRKYFGTHMIIVIEFIHYISYDQITEKYYRIQITFYNRDNKCMVNITYHINSAASEITTIRHLDDIAIIQHDALNEGNEQNFYCF